MGKSQTLFLFSLHLYEKKVTKSLSLNFLTLVSKSEIYESDFSPPPPDFLFMILSCIEVSISIQFIYFISALFYGNISSMDQN